MKQSLSLILLVPLFLACGASAPRQTSAVQSPIPTPSEREPSPAGLAAHCPPPPGTHTIFSITVDGVDVGREVRTDIIEQGPYGAEQLSTSHLALRMKLRGTLFETREVKIQRTRKETGQLLRGAQVIIDQVKTRTYLVGYNGEDWDRLVESRSSVTSPFQGQPTKLKLTGEEVIGFRLRDTLRSAALGQSPVKPVITYYEPLLDGPLELVAEAPLPGQTTIDGQSIDGVWVEARRIDSEQILVRCFFDMNGRLWIEEYPSIRQVRRRMPGPLPLSADTSELLIGLYSKTYLADPNAATRATFLLTSTPDRLDALSLLGEPANQTTKRTAPDKLTLEVRAGSPDGDDPPGPADLGSSEYVQPDKAEIVQALRYLRTGGKRGHLPKLRRFNATRVIARASLITTPRRFWADPDQVAGLIMHYVSALLPDKTHTYSMIKATATLARGGGDCTEHAVLFASLMRAHGIPTRLVAGMTLTSGGIWGYHMWNSYWDGVSWQGIDPSTMSYRPGAVYVALGRGTPKFKTVRNRLADFMWRTFSGITFDLTSAANDGETLFLARPSDPGHHLGDAALFNAVVLSERGDHRSAIAVLDKNIPPSRRSLSVALMRTELLVRDGQHEEALQNIARLREETSLPRNIMLLDYFELDSLLSMGLHEQAEETSRRIDERLARSGDQLSRSLLRAKVLFGSNKEKEAILLLKSALDKYPENTHLKGQFAEYVSLSKSNDLAPMVETALKAVQQSASETLYSDSSTLATWARILSRTGNHERASWILDHAFILAPADRTLHELRRNISLMPCESRKGR
jgi:tetratricopeptide (TPR) repeat protein